MSKIRRIGRELALKALFQLEVGKQPIEEVLQGTRLQIVDLACQPAFQAVQESISECKAVLAPLELDMSVPSKRQIRKLASDCSKTLKTAAAQIHCEVSELAKTNFDHTADAKEFIIAAVETARNSVHSVCASSVSPGAGDIEQIIIRKLTWSRDLVISRLTWVSDQAATLNSVVPGVLQHKGEIDAEISRRAEGWPIDRQPAVDRNVLRSAIFELRYTNASQSQVINEAVELAKRYSTKDSGKFVNGLLAAVALDVRNGVPAILPEVEEDVDDEVNVELEGDSTHDLMTDDDIDAAFEAVENKEASE